MGAGASKPVCKAAQNGDLEEIRVFLQRGGDVNERDNVGMVVEREITRTILMYAADKGHADVVRLLLQPEHGPAADTALRDEDEKAALHFAAQRGRTECLELLVTMASHGASPEHMLNTWTDKDGRTALHVAVSWSQEASVRYLLSVGASCEVVDHTQGANLPLHLCKELDILEALLTLAPSASDTITRRNAEGYAILHISAKEGRHSMVEALLEKRADPNAPTESGRSPLRLACGSCAKDRDAATQCVILLLGRGAMVGNGDAMAAEGNRPVERLLREWQKLQTIQVQIQPPLTETEKDLRISRLTAELEATERRLREEKSQLECTICMNEKRAVVFLPCGHIVCCKGCAARVQQCPVDRATITEKKEVYLN